LDNLPQLGSFPDRFQCRRTGPLPLLRGIERAEILSRSATWRSEKNANANVRRTKIVINQRGRGLIGCPR
jgi:hypothetical protein